MSGAASVGRTADVSGAPGPSARGALNVAGELTGAGVTVWWIAVLVSVGCLAGASLGWCRERGGRRKAGRLFAGPAHGEPVSSGRRPGAGGADEGEGAAEAEPSGGATRTGARSWAGRFAVRAGLRKAMDRWPLREGAAAAGAAALGVVLVDGGVGWALGGAGACGAWWWSRARLGQGDGAEAAAEARVTEGQLPLTAELLAACLAAGSAPGAAAEAVGRSQGGPLGERLVRAATELRLGGEPADVWGRFGAFPGGAQLARCLERAGSAGVPAVEPVTRLAAELRARGARAATARARRAAVLVTGPLGLCFLPAFLAVGVAPVVMGLARSLL
ncbi:type II secretion system F family protein [Streptomyces daliensis]